MAYKFGSQFNNDFGSLTGNYFQIGRVKSVVLGPLKGNSKTPDPDYSSPADIGKIKYELIYSPLNTSFSDQVSEPAYPIFNFVRQYPVVNEIVLILVGPSEGLNDSTTKQQFFYFPPYNVWNHANHNAFPNMAEYAQYLNQFSNEPGYSGGATEGRKLPLGYTFQEKPTIRNIQPFEGDTIFQSRFGQSIRFGSTVPVLKKNNTWSNSGNNGDPITIILNSQAPRPGLNKFENLIEDINKDGSGIWMTSTQEIFLEDINNFPLSSFGMGINTIIQDTVEIPRKPISNEFLSPSQQDQNSIG